MRGPEGRGKGKVRMDTEQGALELFVVPAGRSGMDTLMDLAAAYGGTEREKTLFVASSRELVQRARGRRLNAVNFEYLVHEILRRCAPAGVQRVPISRKTQELLLERLLDETFLLELDPDSRAYRQRENLRELARKKSFRQAMVALIGQLGRAGVTSEEFRRITETWLRDNDMPDKDRLAYISETICAIYGAYGTFLASLSGRGERPATWKACTRRPCSACKRKKWRRAALETDLCGRVPQFRFPRAEDHPGPGKALPCFRGPARGGGGGGSRLPRHGIQRVPRQPP